VLEFVSSIINHRVNLGKLLKIFQVAKNHNATFAGSNVYRIIHMSRDPSTGTGCGWAPPGRDSAAAVLLAPGPGAGGVRVVSCPGRGACRP